jgi:hypothetical protein
MSQLALVMTRSRAMVMPMSLTQAQATTRLNQALVMTPLMPAMAMIR